MKFRSIKSQMIFLISMSSLVVLIAIILYATIAIRKNAIENSKEKTVLLAERFSLKIETEMEIAMDVGNTTANVLKSFVINNFKKVNRGVVLDLLKEVLVENPNFVGISTIWESNAFDGKDSEYKNTRGHDTTGCFAPYWSRDNKGNLGLEPLVDYTVEGLGDYYLIPRKTKKELVTDPYSYEVQGKSIVMTSLMTPIVINGVFHGVLGIDIPIDFIQRYVEESQKINENINIDILSANGIFVASTNYSEYIGKNASEIYKENNYLEAVLKGGNVIHDKDDKMIVEVPIYVGKTEIPSGEVRITIPNKVIMANAKRESITMILLGLIGIVLTVALITLIANNITRPLIKNVNFAKEIASGNLTSKLEINETNELGVLSNSLVQMVAKFREIISGVNNGALKIVETSKHLNDFSLQLSVGANEQASSSSHISKNLEEMANNIKQNVKNIRQTEDVSIKAQFGIAEVSEKAKKVVDANNTITEKIGMINDIAFKTNVLALNAAVESAKAGKYGKGFSVVSAEVGKLAERSKLAAQGISESQKFLAESGESLKNVIPEIEKTVDLIKIIATSGMQQNSSAEEVSEAIHKLTQVAQQNAAASEELSASSEEMINQAEFLRESISYFKINTNS